MLSGMLRRLRRLRVTAIFYTCGGLTAILLLVNFNEDVKRLLTVPPSHTPHTPTAPPPKDPLLPRSFSPPHDFSNDLGGVAGSSGGDVVVGKTFEPPATGPNYLELDEGPEKPWYMWGGSKYPPLSAGVSPNAVDTAKLWHEDNREEDRILEQLMFWIDDPLLNPNGTWWGEGGETTSGGESVRTSVGGDVVVRNESAKRGAGGGKVKVKNILLYYGLGMSWGAHVTSGRSVFLSQKCPVNSCRLTGNRAHLPQADVVVFKDVFMNPKVRRVPSQLWVIYMLECPLNTQNFIDKNVFNLTATYRHDSDIVTPYEKWVYYDDNVKTLKQGVNYSEGKSKKVAWFVSNCVAKNNRLDYARELSKYIEVDIYGACGTHSCSRANAKQCFDLLAKNYKFYLAFENSNCRDYISEKFFVNGLGNNVLPIVMGAHPDDYKRVAPYKSYIHVDDFASPKELAEYLYLLDSNNELYNEYFGWKGTGEFINTHFFCRLCAMAHYAEKSSRKPRVYRDFNKWWRGPHVCTRRSWRGQPDIFAPAISSHS